MSGWIKLHRQFKDWEWYNKSEMVHFFIHCLVKANYKDGSFQGIECKKGEFITSLKHLSEETNISIQTIRTCLKKLILTNEINVKTTNKLTKITICKYESYQSDEIEINKQLTNNQQTTNKQLTTIEEYKERKEEKEYNIIPENKFSDEVISFYNEIIGYFNLTQSHTQTTKEKWLDCIDKLVRIDNLNFDQIKVIVKWARNDEFWKTNFLSILKLRNKNKDDIKYWEVFKEKSDVEYNKNNQQVISSKEVDIFARFRKS